ncbi:MAG: hypothetical protein IJL69_01530 [Oscillospiraceae bacterium]|nr:hypothetical protein [Oscillospiraceae bacterium]
MTRSRCAERHILRAYRILGGATPLPADCGRLCGAACCRSDGRGEDDELGMLLFPGEERFFSPSLKKQRTMLNGREVVFASCSGRCFRPLRPLACRIFPMLPYVPAAERRLDRPLVFSMIPDPRGKYLCPLIRYDNHVDEAFIEKAARAVAEAGRCRTVRRFLFQLSEVADGWLRFTED